MRSPRKPSASVPARSASSAASPWVSCSGSPKAIAGRWRISREGGAMRAAVRLGFLGASLTWGAAPGRCSAARRDHAEERLLVGELARLLLRPDLLAVHRHLEHAAPRGLEREHLDLL